MELTLETPRLRVRPFRGEDEAALAEILGDPAVMAWIEPSYTPEQTRRFLARAGLGVCVQGGDELAMQAADRSCPPAAECGVAQLCREVWPEAFSHEKH